MPQIGQTEFDDLHVHCSGTFATLRHKFNSLDLLCICSCSQRVPGKPRTVCTVKVPQSLQDVETFSHGQWC